MEKLHWTKRKIKDHLALRRCSGVSFATTDSIKKIIVEEAQASGKGVSEFLHDHFEKLYHDKIKK